jgi:hypothetical protein
MQCVYSGLRCYPPLLNITGSLVLPCKFKNSSVFTAFYNNSLSARYVSAANLVSKNVDISRKPITPSKQIPHLWHFLINLSMFF